MTQRLLRSLRAWPVALATAPLFASSARMESHHHADGPSFTEKTVGNYENRLRKFSSPERVFEYFSSVEIDKQFFMTRDDLARAITPYTFRSGAPLASKNSKFNPKAFSAKPSKVRFAKIEELDGTCKPDRALLHAYRMWAVCLRGSCSRCCVRIGNRGGVRQDGEAGAAGDPERDGDRRHRAAGLPRREPDRL